jgi:hypothetical protein
MDGVLKQLAELEQTVHRGGAATTEVGPPALLAAMLVSVLCGLFAQRLYQWFFGSRATGTQVHRAFVLLSASVTGIFICIQFSLPLSLGLLGALSIVRFRTPIKEPEEIGFIMLVIMTSIACATFNFVFLLIALGVAVVGLCAHSLLGRLGAARPGGGLLVVTLPAATYSEVAEELRRVTQAALRRPQLCGLTEAEGTTTVTYAFQQLRGDAGQSLRDPLRALAADIRITLALGAADGAP